jgi:hypothetical protein
LEQKGIIDESKNLCKQIGKKFGEIKKIDIGSANSLNDSTGRDRILNEIEVLIGNIPSTNKLWKGLEPESYNKSFDTILTGMKTAALRWQKHLIRAQNLEISNLKNKLKGLNLNENKIEYLDLESKLVTKQALKLREQLLDSKISEVLGSEKPSKTFIEISKITSSDADLSIIKNENGETFRSKSEQNEYRFIQEGSN